MKYNIFRLHSCKLSERFVKILEDSKPQACEDPAMFINADLSFATLIGAIMFKIFIHALLTFGLSASAFAQGVPTTLPKKKVQSQAEQPVNPSAPEPRSEVEVANTGITPSVPDQPTPGSNPVDLGFPKHQVQVSYLPTRVSTKLTHQGENFRLSPESSDAFGFLYRFLATPQAEVELDYSNYRVTTGSESANTSALGAVSVLDSSTKLESIFLRFNQFWFDELNFFYRYGIGIEIGTDSYPTLAFASPNQLTLSKARDLIVGLNGSYQHPVSKNLLLLARTGFNIGTGSGNTADLKTKKNNSYFAFLSTVWAFDPRSSIELGIDYRVRDAEISGDRDGLTEEWESETTNTTLKLGYIYTFE